MTIDSSNMTTVTCDKCDGTGRIPAEKKECGTPYLRGHEAFVCWAHRQHPGQPHMFMAGQPDCPVCGGMDEHDQQCPRPDILSESDDWFSWREGEGLTPVSALDGKAWFAVFGPTNRS